MNKSVEQWMAEVDAKAAERERKLSMMGDLNDGAIFRSAIRDAWCMVLPDVDGGGCWRLQYFDCRGFSGHRVFANQKIACREMLMEGYKVRDDDALERVQCTHAFKRGNFATELITKVNLQEITMTEMHQHLLNYDLQQQPVLH